MFLIYQESRKLAKLLLVNNAPNRNKKFFVRLVIHLRPGQFKVKLFVVSPSFDKALLNASRKAQGEQFRLAACPLGKRVAVRLVCNLEFVNNLPHIY